MPKRTDIKKILLIGSGPIVIGQACEFDYSGAQACKALREEGYTVVLVNSNPATIMTDPGMADRTYIEPVTPEAVAKIIEKERPDALLPTLGGQTGLNTAIQLAEAGVLKKFNVKMIGADEAAINKAEKRELFKAAMLKIGLDVPKSCYIHTLQQARDCLSEIGLPCVIRPGFTLGGTGGGIAYNAEEYEEIVARGLMMSLNREVLVEESALGWKEYELEVMRDKLDNVVIICSIENFDPMGVHTGDSITVAPAQTLTDKEYQRMRDAAIKIIREIGVETGGSNIQFAVQPETGRMIVIEMNPRVSRSSALASKATGFPIAKIAAKLAVGYTLSELPNDITRETPACFEPTIDYCVVKIPRFAFEKFPAADPTLTTQMKSVGEVMAIGRTFKESLQKALRGLEIKRAGLGADPAEARALAAGPGPDRERLTQLLSRPNAARIFAIRQAFKAGFDLEKIHEITNIDPWFLRNIQELIATEERLRAAAETLPKSERPSARSGIWLGTDAKKLKEDVKLLENLVPLLRDAKRDGFSDAQIGCLWGMTEDQVRELRYALKVRPAYKLVDTCAAEFEAYTPYYYSSYEDETEVRVTDKKKIMILGGGPNRIGQGIEFDYCCCHAAYAMQELGYESIMVNSNPETVSTDYDTSDLLFFEPLTLEDVLHINETLKPDGAIVQFGGQTPLNLARGLHDNGVKLVGTSVESIEAAEDRKLFNEMIERLHLMQPPGGTAMGLEEARKIADRIGYPVLVRPSYVLGGRAMEICYEPSMLQEFVNQAIEASPDAPVLIDKFIEEAIEVDVDAVSDGTDVIVAGVLEHIEHAGTHSGDAAMAMPPHSLSEKVVARLYEITEKLARELKVCGLMNVQYAVKRETIYVLEVNPRASRTVPFVAKATGVPWAAVAAKCMVGVTLKQQGITKAVVPEHICIKESVFPFNKFLGSDTILGPEMRSTGEVMGIDTNFGIAFAKAQMAANQTLPKSGKVFLSVNDADKRHAVGLAQRLKALGFEVVSTGGTHKILTTYGIASERVKKISEGRPNMLDMAKNGEIALVLNTPSGKGHHTDEAKIRSAMVAYNIPLVTSIAAAEAAIVGIEAMRAGYTVKALQDYYPVKK
ncbi:MAG: carbamoyl-phosphate synthase large subunit [Planctomycetes bacterium]|nr:carbamoyl-phosphate synthase large subunit [Planctomycetota bacterium]